MRFINEALQIKIKTLVPEYDPKNDALPQIVCAKCTLYIFRGKSIKAQPDLLKFVLKKKTRSQQDDIDEKLCDCPLCKFARQPTIGYLRNQKGTWNVTAPLIFRNGLRDKKKLAKCLKTSNAKSGATRV